jgi:undecaprenyl-phosphate galactose phosphotransferase
MFLKKIAHLVFLLITDLGAYLSAMLLAIWFRIHMFSTFPTVFPHQASNIPFYWSHLTIWWIPVILILTLAYEGVYIKRSPFWQEMWQLLRAGSLAMLIVLAIISLGKISLYTSRVLIVALWLFLLFFLPFYRFLGKKILARLNLWQQNVLIMGAGDAGMAVLKGLDREQTLGYRVIGFLDDDPEKIGTTISTPRGDYRVFGSTRHFKKFVHLMKISTFIVALPSLSASELARIVSEVQQYVSQVMIVPEMKGIALLNTELCTLFMEQLFLIRVRNNLKSLYSRLIKRSFDCILTCAGFLVISPLLAVLCLAVKLTSKGPVFFVQHRPGQYGRLIPVYKFRTMYIDSDQRLKKALDSDPVLQEEWNVFRKLKTYDPRVTPIGRFLRKWSLDELPQVFNILKGEMSLVGPRPYMLDEMDKLDDDANIILMAKPGLCGLWQASGRNNLSFEDRVKLETWYVLNWSIWLDILLIFKTARAVFIAEGAY